MQVQVLGKYMLIGYLDPQGELKRLGFRVRASTAAFVWPFVGTNPDNLDTKTAGL